MDGRQRLSNVSRSRCATEKNGVRVDFAKCLRCFPAWKPVECDDE